MNKIVYGITGLFAGLLISYVVSSLGIALPTGATTNIAFLGSTVDSGSTAVLTRAKILSSNSGRQYANIQAGAVAVYLMFDSETTTPAVYLPAYGSYTINMNNLYNGNVYASSSGATSTVLTIEK